MYELCFGIIKMHYQNKWIIWLLVGFWLTDLNGQWCCVDSTVLIQDKTTASLKLLISSALNNNLANIDQGVCGVRIQFEHEFIGDLTMDLISPAGQRLRLVGPIGNSGISDFSHWSVTFIPCGDKSIPDKGFKMKWDNQQAWGIFGKFYNGTYYPEGGCLESFDMGSVNGIWTLEVHDDERFYEGKIESFCLLFCDPSGINCMDCSPNGGVFINNRLDYCVNDPLLDIQERITFPVYKPDSTSYSYAYLISVNDTIVYIGDTLDLRNYSIGDYVICGISYLTTDSIKLPKLGMSIAAFRNDLVVNLNSFCAEISKNCLEVSIHPNYAQVKDSFYLCRGDTLTLGASQFFADGQYLIPLRSSFGCDSMLELQLKVVDMAIHLSDPDTITCSKPIVQLDISNSVKTTRTHISWSTNDGNFIDLSDSLKPKINQAGTYKVVFDDGFCFDSLEFNIIKRDQIPDLSIRSDTINCFHSRATIKAVSNGLNPIYSWSDGTNLIGMDSIIQVNQEGSYYVTVTDDAGCSNVGVIEVIRDTLPADLILTADNLSCRDSIGTLSFSSSKVLLDFMWTGPNLFQSKILDPNINLPGFYTLTVTADNGCTNTANIRVTSTIYKPDFSYTADTLNCLNNFNIQIKASSNAVLDSINYSNAIGFKSNLLNPTVHDSGYYQVYLRDTAACVLDTFIYIHLDSIKPLFGLKAGILDCSKDSIQILLVDSFLLPGLVYQWTGPIGFNEMKASPYIKEAGIYKIQVTGLNGCSTLDSIEIKQDTLKPIIQLSSGIIDCNTPNIQINADVSVISNYLWSGPNFFTSILEDPFIQDSGIYKLIATSFNGCKTEKSIYVPMNRDAPIDTIIGQDINCLNLRAIISIQLNQAIDSIVWVGPNTIQAKTDTIHVNQPGIYKVWLRGINGCIDSAAVQIVVDTSLPDLKIIADTITCLKTDARLQFSSLDSIINNLWIDPLGNQSQNRIDTTKLPGWHKLYAQGKNGCTSWDSILVVSQTNKPILQFVGDSITCIKDTAILDLFCNDSGVQYQWNGPANFSSINSGIQTDVPGWYYYTVTNEFGCFVVDSFEVKAYKVKPITTYSDTIFDCNTRLNPILYAFVQDSINLSTAVWTFPDGSLSSMNPLQIKQSGIYLFEVINKFGCINVDTLTISFDTTAPHINFIQLDTLSCSIIQFTPLVEVVPPNSNYEWNGPGNFFSRAPNPFIRLPGVYQLKITGPNHCSIDTNILVVKDSSLPIINAFGSVLDCSSDSTQIRILSNDSLVNVFWQSPKGDFINERNPFVKDSGWYQLIVEGKNNCLLLDSVYVGFDKALPVFTLQDTFISCLYDSVQLGLQTNEMGLNYAWERTGMIISNLKDPFVKDTGFYAVRVRGLNHCEQLDSLYVDDLRQKPALLAVTDTITCINSKALLKTTFDTLKNKFLWSGPFGLDSVQQNPKVSIPGVYHLSIRNQFGCVHDTTLQVLIDTSAPLVQIIARDSLICDRDEINLFVSSACNQCNYSWSTSDGILQSGSSGDSIRIKGSGTYQVLALNLKTGCSSQESITLLKDTVGITGLRLNVKDVSCFGLANGSIQILEILGRFPPVDFSTDGVRFGSVIDLKNLGPGLQHLFFKDRYGCLFDTLIQINEPPQAFLELGRDTSILLGSSYFIDTQTNLDTNLVQSIIWDPTSDLTCIDCIKVSASPKNDTRYLLKIIDKNGCEIEDDITIRITVNSELFIPNAFTPNGDNINDMFSLFSPKGSIKINTLRIFDRWGNQIHVLENFNFSGEFHAWDGRIGDQAAMPGVYVYVIELQNPKRGKLIFKGDLSLIR